MIKIENIITNENKWIYCDFKLSRLLCQNIEIKISEKKINIISFIFFIVYSFSLINIIYFYQFIFKKKNILKYKSIFLKVGEGHDYKYVKFLPEIDIDQITFIDTYNIKDNFRIINVKYRILLKNFFKNIILIKKYIKYRANPSIDFIFKNISKKIALHSYFDSFYYEIKIKKPNIYCYTSGSWFQSLSIINSKIPIIYLSHGLLSQFSSLIAPRFENYCVFSNYEKLFLERKYNYKNIQTYKFKKIIHYNKSIIIYLRQHQQLINKNDLIEIIKFFKSNNYKIYIKEHPKSKFNFRDYYNINEFQIINKHELTYDTLKQISPKYVVGYFSTALCEALNMGILPISLGDKDEIKTKPNLKNIKIIEWTIYPFIKKTISWKREILLLKKIIKNDNDYSQHLQKLINE